MRKRHIPKGRYWDFPSQSYRKITTAQKALKIAKKVDKKQKQASEYSISTSVSTTGTFNATPTVVHVDVGLNETSTLQGIEAFLKSFRFKGYVKAGSAVPENYRIDIILDRLPTPGTLATTNLIYDGAVPPINAMVVMTQLARFKLLRSLKGWVNTADNGGVFLDAYIKLNLKLKTKTASTYTNATQLTNALLIVMWTDAAASQPTFEYYTRSVVLDN